MAILLPCSTPAMPASTPIEVRVGSDYPSAELFHPSVSICTVDLVRGPRVPEGSRLRSPPSTSCRTRGGPGSPLSNPAPFRAPLLFGSLALLVGLCGAPGTFGLGFLLARVALGVGLVLL